MSWIIKSGKGILSKKNGQYLVFDTPADAVRHIEDVCGNSSYLKVVPLHPKSKKVSLSESKV